MPPMWDLRDSDDDDDDDEPRHRGDDDDDDGGGGSGGGDGGDGGGDSGDGGGDSGGGDSGGGDSGGGDSGGGGGFDWGDSGGGDSGGGDSGWSAVQDYEENGRTIRKFTDSTGTDYFQDVGEWSPRGSSPERGFDWGDGSLQQDNGSQGYTQPPDVHPDIQDLHDYYHPYTISKFENDPIRQQWGDGQASDGTRFDQQDPATQDMFTSSYGDRAASSWAEQRSRDLQSQFQSTGVVTLPKPQEPDSASPQPLFGLPRPTNPDGSLVRYTEFGPDQQAYTNMPGPATIPTTPLPSSESAIPPYVPPAAEAPTPQPAAEAPAPQPRPEATPPVTVHPAVQAAADAVARAGGSPDQVAQAAVQATLVADQSRSLSGESMDTQIRFRGLYGAGADATWRQQHTQELALNRALYGTEEPQAGARQTGAIPGLGSVGPAPDRTIGRAQPAPWNVSPAGPAAAPPVDSYERIRRAATALTGETHTIIDNLVQPPPSAIYQGSVSRAASALTGETHGLIDDILQRPLPVETGATPAAVAPLGTRGPTTVPPPLTAAQAAAYERGGVNPATGDIDVQATPPGPGGESASDILTIRNGLGQVRQEPRWAWDQRGPQGQQVWEVVNAEGRPTQTMREAGYLPTSNQIDTSIRASAGIATPENPDMGPREADRSAPLRDPLGFVVTRAAQAQGATDLEGFGRNVAAALATREAWAEPYANDLARLAWYRESRGLEGSPEQAPTSYIEDWKGAFRSGDINVPGVREVSAELVSRGIAPPSVQASTAPSAPSVQTNLAKWTTPGSSIPGTRLVPDQFTDPSIQGLPGWQSDAACGITAAVGVTRALGLDVNPADALAAARRYGGWTPGAGMGGTAGEVAMLRQLGAPALDPVRADQGRIDAELAAGRPVVIDTAGSARIPSGHYFTISSKTEDGLYVVSGSGTALREGAAIMSRDKMEQLTGTWRNAVYLDPSKLPQGGERQAPQPTLASDQTTVRMQSTENAPPSEQANLKPSFTGDEAVAMRQRIMAEMPDIQFAPGDDVETRMQKIAPAVEWLQREYGVSAAALVGLAYNENHIGQANSGAVRGNNLWSVGYDRQDPLSPGPIPEGRFAQYPSIKAGLARFVAMYAHPDNGYKGVWENRGDDEKFFKALGDNKYFVVEPGFEQWDPRTGAKLYRQRSGRGG